MNYWDIIHSRSSDDLLIIAQMKRVDDLIRCLPEFQEAIKGDFVAAVALAKDYGAEGDEAFLTAAIIAMSDRVALDGFLESSLRKIWSNFQKDKREVGRCVNLLSASANPVFAQWQARQRLRVASELGSAADGIPHSLVTFELARGCSVGCSFCGIDAAKFAGHVPYDDLMALEWPRMIEGLAERFGDALQSGFLYWGSDPLDNPDYLHFAMEFARISSVFPQITTAVPLRNVEMVRDALKFSPGIAIVPHRFSILTLNIFKRVMRLFSPEELLHVELVPQLKEGNLTKANAGRAMKGANPSYVSLKNQKVVAPTTIACVTGFLVNIGYRTVKLISPTAASSKWPNGYIEFAERSYIDADDFLRVIDEMVAGLSTDGWKGEWLPCFRRDLQVLVKEDTFDLTNSAVRHHFRAYGTLAREIDVGRHSLNDLLASASERGNSSGEELLFLQGIYKAGLLELETA